MVCSFLCIFLIFVYCCAWLPATTIHNSKYGTTHVVFASTYTAKQLKTMYYSLIMTRDEMTVRSQTFFSIGLSQRYINRMTVAVATVKSAVT